MYELEKKTPEVRRGRSKNGGKNLRLLERDFLVLRFILEMKFCSAEQIWERFYRYAGGAQGKIKYTQNRLSRLRRSEYLNSHFTYDGPVRYYTATAKTFDLVLNHFDLREKDMPETSKIIDMRSFIHDKGLVWLRVFFENMGLIDAFSWESEACIKRRTLFGLTPEVIKMRMQNIVWPDALIKLKAGKNAGTYSLEFEHSVKAHDRRRDKISNYWRESGNNVQAPTLFIYSNSQVERAYAENFREFFDAVPKQKYRGDHLRSTSELEEIFFGQVFMVANYSEVREKYEKFLGEKSRSTIELEAICSLEPRFLEMREKLKKQLLEEKMEKERVAEIERQKELKRDEWKSKGAVKRAFSKPPKEIQSEV